jgi:trafficking protein particle complex subunit 2
VDRFNSLSVSAYASQGGKILLLLHQGKSEDAVRTFFVEAHELYVKYLMNPFANAEEPIISPQFNAHMRQLVKRYLS